MKWLRSAGLATAAVVLLSAAPVQAQEENRRWAGVYIGAGLGGALGNVDWSYFNNPSQTVSRDPSGMMAGILAGVQTQWRQLVIGAELPYSGGAFDKIDDRGPDAPSFAARLDSYARIHDLVTIGPQLGWAFRDQWMIYGTGGYASSRVTSAFILLANPINGSDYRSNRHEGWFVGGGLEHAVGRNWIIGIDYKHAELETILHGPFVPNPPGGVTDVSRNVSPSIDVVMARLSFKLGLPE